MPRARGVLSLRQNVGSRVPQFRSCRALFGALKVLSRALSSSGSGQRLARCSKVCPFVCRFRPIYLAGFSGQQLSASPKRRLVPLSPQFPEKRKGLLFLEFSSSISTILPNSNGTVQQDFSGKIAHQRWDQGGKLPRAGGCERFFESLQGTMADDGEAMSQRGWTWPAWRERQRTEKDKTRALKNFYKSLGTESYECTGKIF